MKNKRTMIALLAVITMLSACSGSQTAPETTTTTTTTMTTTAPETTTAAAATTVREHKIFTDGGNGLDSITNSIATKESTTTTAPKTAAPETTTTYDAEAEKVVRESSEYFTKTCKGYTYDLTAAIIKKCGFSDNDIIGVTANGEKITDSSEWMIDSVEFNLDGNVYLYVHKDSLAKIASSMIGLRYSDAYDILKSNGATYKTVHEFDENGEKADVWVKKNWVVSNAILTKEGGTLYADVYLIHDEGNVLAGIIDGIAENYVDNFNSEHPIAGGIIKGFFN